MPSRRANYNGWQCTAGAVAWLVPALALSAAISAVSLPATSVPGEKLPAEASTTTAAATIARAETAFKSGDAGAAETQLNAALQSDPDSIPLLVARGMLALACADLPSASFCHRRAAALEARSQNEPSLAVHKLGEQLAVAVADRDTKPVASRWAQLPAAVTAPLARDTSPTAPIAKVPSPVPASATVISDLRPAITPIPSVAPASAASSASSASSPSHRTNPSSATAELEVFPGQLVPGPNDSDANLLKDAAGQWASNATASSIYSARYGAEQAIGAPNVFLAGNAPEAWAPAQPSTDSEWLEVSFALVGPARGVRVRQNSTPGCITRVEAIDADGQAHLWWAGKDPYVAPRTAQIAWFIVQVSETNYAVAKIRITLDLGAISGWKQIDAVQLIGAKR